MRFQNFIFLFFATLFIWISPAIAATSIPFTINMSETVNVVTTGGTPRIAVDVGGTTRYANYTSGTGTSTLTFTYDMIAGDVDLDGVTLTSPIDLNGGIITDVYGNSAILAYTLPDTSNVRVNYPSLGMDFIFDADGRYSLNGTIYNDLTSFLTATGGSFSRGSNATYFDSFGVMQTAASGAARFDHDPTTLAAKGVLIEESRTNILIESNAFTSSPWNTTTCGGLSASGSTTTAPDGTSVPIYNMTASSCLFQDVAVTNGSTLTHSVWIKANKAGTLGFRTPGTSAITSSPITIGTSWQRYTLTATAVAATSRFLIDNRAPNGYGVTGLQISFFGGQMEVGSFATSYIPTTTASVTRAADALTIPVSSWNNTSSGTFFIQAPKPIAQGVSSRFYALTKTGSGEISLFNHSSSNGNILGNVINSSGTTVAGLNQAGLTVNSTFKSAFAYNTNDFSQSTNGGAVVTDTSGTFPSFTNLNVGNISPAGVRSINSSISKLSYFPARVPNAQLLLMTQ